MESTEPSAQPICQLCNLSFNQGNKEAINFDCCQYIACRECVETRMMKNQTNNFTINEQLDCPFCHKDDNDLEYSVKVYPPNVDVAKEISQVTCEKHPE